MTDPQIPQPEGGDPLIGRLVHDAFRTTVDVETASRHLWRLHQVAGAGAPRGVRRTLVSALAAVLLFATTAVTVALSGGALPGEPLYLVKRGAERVHLLVSFAPESDARLHLRFARSRAVEVQGVAASRPDRVPVLLSEIIAAVDRAQVVGGTALSEEVELVRQEVSTALSSLNAVVDAELSASVDATLQELEAGRAVSGSRDAPVPQPPPPGQPGGEDGEAGEHRHSTAEPPGSQPAGSQQPKVSPSETVSEQTIEEPTASPVEEPTATPVEEPTATPVEEPSASPTARPGGMSKSPAGAPETARPETPAATQGDTAVPALDRLEDLLREPDIDP